MSQSRVMKALLMAEKKALATLLSAILLLFASSPASAMLEGQRKNIYLNGNVYEVKISRSLEHFEARNVTNSQSVTDFQLLAELFQVNHALLFAESILDFQKGALLNAIFNSQLAVEQIDIVESLEDTYDLTISTAGIIGGLYGGFTGIKSRVDATAEISAELATLISGLAFRDARASVYDMFIDSALASADVSPSLKIGPTITGISA